MNNVFKIEPSFAQHFSYADKEFEIRITDDGNKLEIWEVGYENGNCIGFVDMVAEFNLKETQDENI
jgi:hypothetical protein